MAATSQKVTIVTALFREAYPRHTAKRVAIAADAPLSTAKAWISGRRTPPADILLTMASRCEALAFYLERILHARRGAGVADPVTPGSRQAPAPTAPQVPGVDRRAVNG